MQEIYLTEKSIWRSMYYNDENKQIFEFDKTSWAYFEEKTLFIYNPYIPT
jgi:hypothetical protein